MLRFAFLRMSDMNDSSSKLLAALFAERQILSVSELNERIKDLLEVEFFTLHVQGEISNYRRHSSGHWYFTLKDSQSQLRAVYFRQWNRLMRFEPENGLEVRVRGRLSVYEPRGEYQIVVELMEPVGVGALQLAFEQQVKRLEAEGLFDDGRKRKLPLLPRRVGIITSPVGAALRDMLQILERRNRGIDVIICPVRVQGASAAREIADALHLLNNHARRPGNEVDVIIIGRGGGSMEDLWAFNEEYLARAIFESAIPVVSAVGHETDFTIADFVADRRAPTPSAAAEMVAAEASDLNMRIAQLNTGLKRVIIYDLLSRRTRLRDLIESRGFAETARSVLSLSSRRREFEFRLTEGLRSNLQIARARLSALQRKLDATDFRAPLLVKAARLKSADERCRRAIQRSIEHKQHGLAVKAGKLDMLSPLAVLARGYVLVKDEDGHLVSRAAPLNRGQNLTLRFDDGHVACEVKGKEDFQLTHRETNTQEQNG